MNIFKILKHRMYFTVSLSDTAASKTYSPQIGKIFLSVCAVFGAVSVLSVNSTNSADKSGATATSAKESEENVALYEKQVDLLSKENQSYNRQVKVYAQELAVLQARLDKFDNIAKRLLDDERFVDDVQLAYEGAVDTEGLYDEEFSVLDLENNFARARFSSSLLDESMNSIVELLGEADKVNLQASFNWPVINKRTFISSHYGERKDPFTRKRTWHSGIDIAAGWNAPIVAVSDGVVIHSGYRYGYGISVEIQHQNGVKTRYAHLNKATIKKGDVVKHDELIGLMGSSGRSTGPHLHFEILVDGKRTDPTPYIIHDRKNAITKAEKGLVQKTTEKS